MPGLRKITSNKTSKRTRIEPHSGDKRYVRRNKAGDFKKEVGVGRSLAADRPEQGEDHSEEGAGGSRRREAIRVLFRLPGRTKTAAKIALAAPVWVRVFLWAAPRRLLRHNTLDT